MFARSIQPDVVSLFSSTGSDPLGLFLVHVDASLPADAFVHLLHDATSLPAPPSPAALIALPCTYPDLRTGTSRGHELDQTVLHIQSPTLRKTFIQCPPVPLPTPHGTPANASGPRELGLTHAWLHIQVRNLGRDWSFEVGVVDKMGRHGTVRCSTFQKSPNLVRNLGASPLLHLPLTFPSSSTNPLTAWSTITLDLSKFGSQFASLAHTLSLSDRDADEDAHLDHDAAAERGGTSSASSHSQAPLPFGTYSHLAYIKIYATCRLRRIWLSQSSSSSAPITRTPWEFELYGD